MKKGPKTSDRSSALGSANLSIFRLAAWIEPDGGVRLAVPLGARPREHKSSDLTDNNIVSIALNVKHLTRKN
jgi:hypothetical protein